MVDGKVVSACTNTAASATCPICGATPKFMNDLVRISSLELNQEALLMDMSPMHMYIRCFEKLLHISIRLVLPTLKWQITGADNKEIAKERKQDLRKKFKTEWGMVIETPNRTGSGNTHTGNLARRLFRDPIKAADLLNVDEALIHKMGVILFVINSGYEIDVEKLDDAPSDKDQQMDHADGHAENVTASFY